MVRYFNEKGSHSNGKGNIKTQKERKKLQTQYSMIEFLQFEIKTNLESILMETKWHALTKFSSPGIFRTELSS